MSEAASEMRTTAGSDNAVDFEKIYNIVEIFHSVQGEGYRSGIPHVFIRFGGCNLRCCLLYTSPSPRDEQSSRMPSSA